MKETASLANPMVGSQEKNWTALSSVMVIVFLTVIKAVIGILTGSLGIMAEAAHSLLDLVAAAVTLFAVRISGRPADRSHTYGHGKVENLSALFEALLLLITCGGIFYEAIIRLFFKHVEVQTTFWSFLVMGVSIIINITQMIRLNRVAKKFKSQALEAEALDFKNDVWSSSVVFCSLGVIAISRVLNIHWLENVDSVAGIIVAGIVTISVTNLARRAIGELLDEVPDNLQGEISRVAILPGVEQVQQVKVRRSGPQYFVDLTLEVSRSESSEQAHLIASQVEKAVQTLLPEANVMVHIDPIKTEDEQLADSLRAMASWYELGVHHIRVRETRSKKILTLHLDTEEETQIEEAHTRVTALEEAIYKAYPEFEEVWTHIEPVQRQQSTSSEEFFYHDKKVEKLILNLPREINVECEIHEITLMKEGKRLNISFHCMLQGNTSVYDAHKLTEKMENLLRSKISDIENVIIHIEPLETKDSI
jgi:cation diffusion facilitator family transporter